MMQLILSVLLVFAFFNQTYRKILGIVFIIYNINKLWGLRKDRFDIEKIIVINGACLLFGVFLLFS